MSTKIYDAYKFDKMYSVTELSEMFNTTRELVKEKTIEMIESQIVYLFNFYYNFRLLHKDSDIQKRILTNRDLTNIDRLKRELWRDVLFKNWRVLFLDLQLYIDAKSNEIDNRSIFYNLDCNLQIIPVKNKILTMAFGNSDLIQVAVDSLPLIDYHYQNQTDKPSDISNYAWNTRKNVWDAAIGPDYIPANHGFSVNFKPSSLFPPFGNMFTHNKILTEIEKNQLVSELADTFDLGESQNIDMQHQYSYFLSDEFQTLRNKKKKEIISSIKYLSAEDISELLKERK